MSFIYFFYFILPFLTPFFLSNTKLRSAHASTTQIAVVLQSNCEWGACSRSLHINAPTLWYGRNKEGKNIYRPLWWRWMSRTRVEPVLFSLQADRSNQSATVSQDNNAWETCPRLRSGLRHVRTCSPPVTRHGTYRYTNISTLYRCSSLLYFSHIISARNWIFCVLHHL